MLPFTVHPRHVDDRDARLGAGQAMHTFFFSTVLHLALVAAILI